VSLDVGDAGRVVRHVGEDESLFVVILAQYLVLAQVEAVTHAEPATRHVCYHQEHELVLKPFCITMLSGRGEH
jgi:hypothetical protein